MCISRAHPLGGKPEHSCLQPRQTTPGAGTGGEVGRKRQGLWAEGAGMPAHRPPGESRGRPHAEPPALPELQQAPALGGCTQNPVKPGSREDATGWCVQLGGRGRPATTLEILCKRFPKRQTGGSSAAKLYWSGLGHGQLPPALPATAAGSRVASEPRPGGSPPPKGPTTHSSPAHVRAGGSPSLLPRLLP